MLTKKPPFRPETIVVAVEPHHAADADGNPYTVGFGMRLKATDPRVLANPQYFVEDGEPLVPPVQPEPEEPPAPRTRSAKRYRVKKTQVVRVGADGALALTAGDEVFEGSATWRMLGPDVIRKALLDEVK